MLEVLRGVRMAFRRWPSSVLIVTVLFCTVAGGAIALSSTLEAWNTLRAGAALRDARAVSFYPFYEQAGVSTTSAEVMSGLGDQITVGAAYTAVLFNVEVNDPDFADGHKAVVLVGDAVTRLFPRLHLCEAPCAMRGRSVDARPVEVNIAGETLSAKRSLPRSATLLDPSAGEISLDDDIVIRLPVRDLAALDQIEREEAITRAVLLHPSEAVLDSYVRGAQQGGLALIPQDLRSTQPREFNDAIADSRVQVTTFVGFIGIACLCLLALVSSAVRRTVPGLMIERQGGAPSRSLTVRIASYVIAMTAMGPVCAWLVVRNVAGGDTGAIVAVLFVAALGVSALAASRIVRTSDLKRA